MPLTKPITQHPNYEKFECCSVGARELYFRLRDELDDYALILANAARLKPDLFPCAKRLRESDLAAFVDELLKSGMLRRRHDQHGREVLHLPGCEQSRKRSMSSEHVHPSEASQEFLPMQGSAREAPPPKDKEKEGRKEPTPARAEATQSRPAAPEKINGVAATLVALRSKLNETYRRGPNDAWSNAEEYALVEIHARPDWPSELDHILAFRKLMAPDDRRRFFPQSLYSFLSKWTETLDKARLQCPKPKPPSAQAQMKSVAPARRPAEPTSPEMLRAGIRYLQENNPASPILPKLKADLQALTGEIVNHA